MKFDVLIERQFMHNIVNGEKIFQMNAYYSIT